MLLSFGGGDSGSGGGGGGGGDGGVGAAVCCWRMYGVFINHKMRFRRVNCGYVNACTRSHR